MIGPADPDPLLDLDELERFAGLLDIMQAEGEVPESTEPRDLAAQDFEDFEGRVVELARIDPVVFAQYAFQWPIQPIHSEMHDLMTAHARVVLWAPPEHGKTGHISIARPIWELGVNPSIRIALISDSADQAKKSLATIKQQITLNPRIKAVFPKIGPEKRADYRKSWLDEAIIVERDDLAARDYSIQAIGVHGQIMGARLDLAILDDILDFENTLTPGARERLLSWYDATIEGRSTAYGRIWFVGMAWHRKDIMHELSKREGWASHRFDGRKEGLWPEFLIVDGKPSGWPQWRLDQKRKLMPSAEFDRQFGCKVMTETSEIFNSRAIDQCFERHLGWDPEPDPSWQIFVGVDLNVKKGEARDKTSFFIGRPDGASRIVQRIICDNMNLEEIVFWFYFIEARYHPVIFLVENNAAQDYIVQMFKPGTLSAIFEGRGEDPSPYLSLLPRVQGFTTGSNKSDPILGLRGMTLEFEQKRWRIPDHKLTQQWKDELVDFDPLAHPPDILMSSWLFYSATMKYRPQRIRSRVLGGV